MRAFVYADIAKSSVTYTSHTEGMPRSILLAMVGGPTWNATGAMEACARRPACMESGVHVYIDRMCNPDWNLVVHSPAEYSPLHCRLVAKFYLALAVSYDEKKYKRSQEKISGLCPTRDAEANLETIACDSYFSQCVVPSYVEGASVRHEPYCICPAGVWHGLAACASLSSLPWSILPYRSSLLRFVESSLRSGMAICCDLHGHFGLLPPWFALVAFRRVGDGYE